MKRTSLRTSIVVATALFLASCGSSDDSASSPDTLPATAASSSDDSAAAEEPAAEEAAPEDEQPSGPTEGPNATVTLDNGETFEFSILCYLETQEAAGSEILFTAVSYDDPVHLDVSQFGADSFNGAAIISLYDSTSYDSLWEANSTYGSAVELELDGTTVTGSGVFLRGGELGAEEANGELVANC